MRTKCSVVVILLLAVSLAVLNGCSRKSERTDAQVASDVQNKIYGDPGIQSRQITVQAASGVVTLSGNVESDVERTAASNDAGAIDGVRTVINNLQVQEAQATPPPISSPQPLAPPAPRKAPASEKRKEKNNSLRHRNHQSDEQASDATLANSQPPLPPVTLSQKCRRPRRLRLRLRLHKR